MTKLLHLPDAAVTIIAISALILSRLPGFELRWIWYLFVGAILIQLTTILLLLRREFRLKLDVRLAATAA